MFLGLTSYDVSDPDGLAAAVRAALDVDGPSAVSIECADDEIPPFAPFLGAPTPKSVVKQQLPHAQEDRTDVKTSA